MKKHKNENRHSGAGQRLNTRPSQPSDLSAAITSGLFLASCLFVSGGAYAQPADLLTEESVESSAENQPDEDVDQIVVTGSYLRRSQFETATPIQVITADEVQNSGVAGLGEYIKDLTFMNGISLENDPGDFLAGGDLSAVRPDGIGGGFDLRGFGQGGTLTLVDGQRTSTGGADANGLVPGIALDRVEIATDGAGAAYGSDAIAGVVNIISIREYDGFKMNTFYQRDDGGDYEESKVEMLTGFTIGEWNFVTTFEATQRTTLALLERPEYARAAQTVSARGAPGAYFNGEPANFAASRYLDPGCGADIAETSFDPGSKNFLITGSPAKGDASPSFRPTCYFGVDTYTDILPARDRYVWSNFATYDISDSMTLKLDVNYSWTESETRDYPPVTAGSGTTSGLIEFPRNHPAFQDEPFASLPGDESFYAGGAAWRPFGRFGTLPPNAGASGAMPIVEETYRQRYSARLESQLWDTSWINNTDINYSKSRVDTEEDILLTDRLQAAARGEGGPNGDQWFNPLLSQITDPALANSRELVDWMFEHENWTTSDTEQKSIETRFSGDIYELPAGMIQGAFGMQYHEYMLDSGVDRYAAAENRYHSGGSIGFLYETRSRGAYFEVGVPLFSDQELFGLNIGDASFDVSGRQEWNYDRADTPLTPKYALRWSPNRDLAFRLSKSESARAPSQSNVTLNPDPEANTFPSSSIDPFAEANPAIPPLFEGPGVYYSNGNPDLESALSETINFGFTYRGIENLTLSLDAQEITNFKRIETLGSAEILGRDFAEFQAAGGNPENLDEVLAHFAANPNPLVKRDPESGALLELLRHPTNSGERINRTVDGTLTYRYPTENLGYFNLRLSTTYIDSYKLIPEGSIDGVPQEFVGKRNRGVSGATTLPRWRGNMRLGWTYGPHSVSMTSNYTHHFTFDGDDIVEDFFDVGTVEPEYISSYLRTDLSYTYAFSNFLMEGDGNIMVGSRDVFDRKAQIVPVRQGSIREQTLTGRTFYVQLNYEFAN